MMRTSLFFAAASLIALSNAVALQPISGDMEPTRAACLAERKAVAQMKSEVEALIKDATDKKETPEFRALYNVARRAAEKLAKAEANVKKSADECEKQEANAKRAAYLTTIAHAVNLATKEETYQSVQEQQKFKANQKAVYNIVEEVKINYNGCLMWDYPKILCDVERATDSRVISRITTDVVTKKTHNEWYTMHNCECKKMYMDCLKPYGGWSGHKTNTGKAGRNCGKNRPSCYDNCSDLKEEYWSD